MKKAPTKGQEPSAVKEEHQADLILLNEADSYDSGEQSEGDDQISREQWYRQLDKALENPESYASYQELFLDELQQDQLNYIGIRGLICYLHKKYDFYLRALGSQPVTWEEIEWPSIKKYMFAWKFVQALKVRNQAIQDLDFSPLMFFAAAYNQAEIVHELLSEQKEWSKNEVGETAFELALKREHIETLEVFIAYEIHKLRQIPDKFRCKREDFYKLLLTDACLPAWIIPENILFYQDPILLEKVLSKALQLENLKLINALLAEPLLFIAANDTCLQVLFTWLEGIFSAEKAMPKYFPSQLYPLLFFFLERAIKEGKLAFLSILSTEFICFLEKENNRNFTSVFLQYKQFQMLPSFPKIYVTTLRKLIHFSGDENILEQDLYGDILDNLKEPKHVNAALTRVERKKKKIDLAWELVQANQNLQCIYEQEGETLLIEAIRLRDAIYHELSKIRKRKKIGQPLPSLENAVALLTTLCGKVYKHLFECAPKNIYIRSEADAPQKKISLLEQVKYDKSIIEYMIDASVKKGEEKIFEHAVDLIWKNIGRVAFVLAVLNKIPLESTVKFDHQDREENGLLHSLVLCVKAKQFEPRQIESLKKLIEKLAARGAYIGVNNAKLQAFELAEQHRLPAPIIQVLKDIRQPALFKLIDEDNIKGFIRAITNNLSILELRDGDNHHALHHAIAMGRLKIIGKIIQLTDLSLVYERDARQNPIREAINSVPPKWNCVEVILKNLDLLTEADKNNFATLLSKALDQEQLPVVRQLVRLRVRLDPKHTDQYLYLVVTKGSPEEISQLMAKLEQSIRDPGRKNQMKIDAYRCAVARGDEAIISLFNPETAGFVPGEELEPRIPLSQP